MRSAARLIVSTASGGRAASSAAHSTSALERLPFRNDLRDDADGKSLSRVEAPAQEHQLLRLPGPEQADKPVGASGAGQDAELDLGQPERRGLVGDAEVRCERQLEPAAETPAVDGRDRRHRERGDAFVHVAGIRVVSGDGGASASANSLMSAPAENAFPAPVITTQRLPRTSSPPSASRSSRSMAPESAFSFSSRCKREDADVFLAADVDEVTLAPLPGRLPARRRSAPSAAAAPPLRGSSRRARTRSPV